MKKLLLCIPIFLFLFSCEKENEVIEKENPIIKIQSYYKGTSNGELRADINANVYIYFGFYTLDIADYDINSDGVLTKGDKTIIPAQHIKTDANGKCEAIPEKSDEKVTIIIMSNYYINRISHSSYTNAKAPIKITNIIYD